MCINMAILQDICEMEILLDQVAVLSFLMHLTRVGEVVLDWIIFGVGARDLEFRPKNDYIWRHRCPTFTMLIQLDFCLVKCMFFVFHPNCQHHKTF